MLTFDFSNILKKNIGEESGLLDDFYDQHNTIIREAYKKIENSRGKSTYKFMELPYQKVEKFLEYKHKLDKFDYFVLVGIGGSSLGSYALFKSLKHKNHNIINDKKIFFVDNSDPATLNEVLDVVKLDKTVFNVVTKSGSTAETMSAFSVIFNLLKKRNLDLRKHIIATTSKQKGDLFSIAQKYDLDTFYIPEDVGGRYSIFTPVGFIPALFLDIDIKNLLEGAKFVDSAWRRKQVENNPIVLSGLVNYLYDKKMNRNILALMCYKDKLENIGYWYQQLWAESLGKKYNHDNEIVENGSTPIILRGATDQHSVLQLFMEGPHDKLIVFLDSEETPTNINFKVDELKEFRSLSYFNDKSSKELINSELKGVKYALLKAERPNYTIKIDKIDEYHLGGLLYALELQTVLSSSLYRVNPFDQPGVEEGKKATYALMGRDGYDEKRKEMEENIQKKLIYKIEK
ncbi:MAG: glucose-6-phosphate isomerase [Candidatus Mcinerneyibacterium aminivorans]|uniref:Glucose-6-phosphate isomerase n=1 Tax=Candidatus Mcinerneyibacterium aminivorans TaxID=2703815 RepID=A0A5D0MAS6_9BACT|nr:MAG: glucose-6-phosphate isomerase [Candidatus Mcinerneyibacterium aminivorans]